ncbi:ubiquitin carboxyl-terminal hydrolase 48-like [Diadema antillarum]|uniref:ubiquitin carboxyl-terminal hydrolase 48-like n=1 Tax=Diadema antillarum TaxID=105358 RepID=UPI003A851719
MPSKPTLDKEIWRWTETTAPEDVNDGHVKTVYRINLPSCSSSCRRNCRGNPNCLVNLGEKDWLKEISDDHWHQIDDPEEEKRKEDELVGLKNLGATCYVNTFLQVWFHNQRFREALYQWRPLDREWARDESADERTVAALPEAELQPSTICGHLQLLFALLQFSRRRYIDPANFINCLGLDAALQQDAQEFSKLFISLLESTLREQPNPLVGNVIEQQFSGQYSYVTRCNSCGNSSERPSQFYELDLNIKGHKHLEDSLTEFLKEEKLEGANQYLCERCNCKQNATRCIKLKTLPPVLNIQLLRFVFDRHSGTKKKLNNFLQFPEELDMSKHLPRREKQTVYDLQAVLIHRGPTAYSGHYIAHIRSHGDSGAWFKFNDEEIQKMEGKNLKLGSEDELAAGQKEGRRPKVPKGSHASKNAYMLVYTLRPGPQQENGVDQPKLDLGSLPRYLRELINRDNVRFEGWLEEMTAMRTESVKCGRSTQQEIRNIYQQMPPTDGDGFEWIATEWLKKWLSEESHSSTAKQHPIDNTRFCCRHGRLDPDQVKHLKRISTQAANLLFMKYGGGPRLTQTSLCLTCIKQRCRVMRIQAQLATDHKFVTDVTKVKCQSEDGFWVGKDSLRQWKRMVLEREESQFDGGGGGGGGEERKNEGKDETDTGNHHCAIQNGETDTKDGVNLNESNHGERDEEEDGKPLIFNGDLLCSHGNLSTDVTFRRLVPKAVWTVLHKYFPDCAEFQADVQPCMQCQMADAEDAEQARRKCELATEQKRSLPQLFHGRARPTWKKGESTEAYVVPHAFVEAWRSFLRHPVKSEILTSINNSAFLCSHGGLTFDPSMITPVDETSGVALVWPVEWAVLSTTFVVDQPIRIWKVVADGPCFISEPEICPTCSRERQEAEHEARFLYSGVKVYIRKLAPDFGDSPKATLNLLTEAAIGATSDQENKDPDFNEVSAKRQKMELDGSASSRRSTRHRRVRGEKEIIVSSTNTLKELKIKVMHAFSVAPFDQTLLYRGKALLENEATLGHLGITPESLITLVVDSPICEDPLAMDEIVRASSVPEAGFKGTGLLSS